MLVRVGHGWYTSRKLLNSLTPWEAFALRSRAFVLSCGPGTYAASSSAVAIYGLATLGAPPRWPIAVQPESPVPSHRRLAFGTILKQSVPPGHFGVVTGTPVVSATWAGVDLLRRLDRDAALVLADSAVRRGVTTTAMRAVLDLQAHRPGRRANATWAIDHADGGAESALETLGRLACLEYDVPVPLSNVWVGMNGPVFRLDHLWQESGVAGEGDGARKYRDSDAADVIAREKEREYYLRSQLGLEVVRYGWDLAAHNRRELALRFARALAPSAPRDQPIRWWARGA